ncbi:MAG TPA: hypothetical protein VG815_10230 [Chloroflexota bacterium]|nr:hypothetical protein [Chloroflexota bacterium]
MKTLATVSADEWEEIRDTFRISKVLVWRAPSQQEFRRHQGKPIGMRRLDDGTYEVQINYDAVRCRPRTVHRDQFTLYCLYCGLAKIELGHLDESNQQHWRQSRIRNGRRMGLKTLMAELERDASEWAVDRLQDESGTSALHLAAS